MHLSTIPGANFFASEGEGGSCFNSTHNIHSSTVGAPAALDFCCCSPRSIPTDPSSYAQPPWVPSFCGCCISGSLMPSRMTCQKHPVKRRLQPCCNDLACIQPALSVYICNSVLETCWLCTCPWHSTEPSMVEIDSHVSGPVWSGHWWISQQPAAS